MTHMESPELSIVIPAYNEEARLAASLRAILAYLEKRELSYEILVADDGSRDSTSAVAKSFSEHGVRVIRLAENQGKGAAIRRGVLASLGRLVLLSDADLSTPIEELEKLEARLDDAQVVIGSRAMRDSDVQVHQPFYRELMGKTFNKLIQLLAVRGLRDTQCGFKLLDGRVARDVFSDLVTPGFAYDVEMIWLARNRGHQVVEQGVVWINSPDSKVNPLWDPPKMIAEILRFRWQHRRIGTRRATAKKH